MTNIPPSEPESSQKNSLGFDELIAILVAFSTIGGILFWSMSRSHTGWDLNDLIIPPTPSPGVETYPASSGLKPNADAHLNTLPSPRNVTVVEPRTTLSPTERATPPLVLPSAKVAPIKPSHRQTSFSFTDFESSIQSSPLPLVTPREKKSIIPPPIAFNDVPTDFWAGRFIDVLSSRGIIKGFPDYSFRPNQPVNRAEFATILQQAFDQKLAKYTMSFKDVSDQSWATSAIDQAIATGFLKGYPDQTFQPEQKISRVQVLVALVSGLNLQEPSDPLQVLSVYKDAQDIPEYATKKIATATANGLVVTYPDPNVLAPNQEATRAEVAVMIHQALVQTGRLKPIPSQNYTRLAN